MRVPSYRYHKATGQAIVVIRRRFYYLGRFGSPESREKYERVIGEYLASGRVQPQAPSAKRSRLTVRQLGAAYLQHCRTYYARDGQPTSEYHSIVSLTRKINTVIGEVAAAEVSPSTIEILREKWVEDDQNSRKYVNKQVGRLVRMGGYC